MSNQHLYFGENDSVDADLWARMLNVESLSQIPSDKRFNLHYRTSNRMFVPDEAMEKIVSITQTSDDGRMFGFEEKSNVHFPNVTDMALTDPFVFPQIGKWKAPPALLQVNHLANMIEKEDLNLMKAAERPLKEAGKEVFPKLSNLKMRMYQHYGLGAGIVTLSTMSHLDGALSLLFWDCGINWIRNWVDFMKENLRFPRVKCLKLFFFDDNYLGRSAGSVSEVENHFIGVKLLLQGLFGSKEQKWDELRNIRVALLPGVRDTKVPFQHVMARFPKEEWITAIHRCPKLERIEPYDCYPQSISSAQLNRMILPFLYSLAFNYCTGEDTYLNRRAQNLLIASLVSEGLRLKQTLGCLHGEAYSLIKERVRSLEECKDTTPMFMHILFNVSERPKMQAQIDLFSSSCECEACETTRSEISRDWIAPKNAEKKYLRWLSCHVCKKISAEIRIDVRDRNVYCSACIAKDENACNYSPPPNFIRRIIQEETLLCERCSAKVNCTDDSLKKHREEECAFRLKKKRKFSD